MGTFLAAQKISGPLVVEWINRLHQHTNTHTKHIFKQINENDVEVFLMKWVKMHKLNKILPSESYTNKSVKFQKASCPFRLSQLLPQKLRKAGLEVAPLGVAGCCLLLGPLPPLSAGCKFKSTLHPLLSTHYQEEGRTCPHSPQTVHRPRTRGGRVNERKSGRCR